MTAIAPALQSPLVKAIKFFCEEYFEDRLEIYTDLANLVVEHDTSITKEPIEADCWSGSSESHYTSAVGCNYIASTKILSVKVLIAEGLETACIKDKLCGQTLNQIQFYIESLAEKDAKDGDDDD